MRVVLSGLFFPMAILRYIEKALRRRDDVELFTVGPYTGSWIPWQGGMNLPSRYAIQPNLSFPMNGNAPVIPTSYIESKLPWKPDLWLQIDAGFYLRGKPTNGKNVIVGTDPHVLNYDNQRKLADSFYCMQAHYAKSGDEYLPYAYDVEYHQPEALAQHYDACLIGLNYPNRNRLVEALRERGVKVFYANGPVYDEARALYNQAPIGLNWSSLEDLTARVFELLGMKRLAVVNDVPDLKRFFRSGVDLITFISLEEAVDQVLYYRDNPDAGRKIANIGHETVKGHTWDHRIEQVLNDI